MLFCRSCQNLAQLKYIILLLITGRLKVLWKQSVQAGPKVRVYTGPYQFLDAMVSKSPMVDCFMRLPLMFLAIRL